MTGLRFVAQGLANLVLTSLIYLLALRWLSYPAAYTVAFMFGILFAYVVNRSFVFRAAGSRRAVLAFIGTYLFIYAVGLTITTLLQPRIGSEIALGAALLVTVPLSFLMSRWIFKHS